MSQTSRLNISKSWWRPFLSHVIVFFVLNQCTILYFTIIIRENSLHVTGCIGIEEIQKKFPKSSSLKYFQIVVETSPITCNCIFHVESVYNTLFYNNYKRKLIICDWLCSRRSRDFEFGARSSFVCIFLFRLAGSPDKSKLVCPIPLPFICSRWRSPLSRALFYCLMSPYP
jgi:hypothetical protein